MLNGKFIIEFSFIFNNNIWTWEKIFYNSENVNDKINEYLEQKKLPFELTKKNIKYKIKKK